MNVCFVALHALPVIRPSPGQPVGGTETRAWTFARGLAQAEAEHVQFVIRGPRGMEAFAQDEVQVLPRYDRLYSLYEAVGHCVEKRPGFPSFRLRRWHPKLLWQVPLLAVHRYLLHSSPDPLQPDPFYEAIETDVFCTFGVQSNSARVIASAHAAGKPTVLMIGSDGDLDERYTADSDYVSQYGDVGRICHWIIRRADSIAAQTPQQQQWLRERFHRDSTVVANPFDLDCWDDRADQHLPKVFTAGLKRPVLWIGRSEAEDKRPQLLLELARRCPDLSFLMVLNPRDPIVERQIHQECPANVSIVPAVPFDLMPALFRRAAVLVSTSATEGFPNVFLQAAAAKIPIASLEVGEEFLAASGAGTCCHGDLERLADVVRRFWSDGAEPNESIRAYLREHHDHSQQVQALKRVLEQVAT